MRELKRGGYEPVFERVNNPAALSAALEKKEWDVVLSDYVMPQLSGLDALGLLKKKGLDPPFIVISGKVGEDTAVETMKASSALCFVLIGVPLWQFRAEKPQPTVQKRKHNIAGVCTFIYDFER